ncbi:S-methyl-5-thioribose-1-phosphate isomerase [uncultured Pseudoflavonifractor sp.]|uniref:S-methyl-5-thioribose-1-phosphate isomerase n=1 Tax=uncultured Pseudoflavonifractor sp. TaxID=1221379 RepID=UPI0025F54835|nr:S-methyl-5-thioribose-1-phosphate isomerase [uncultured Pseudoflavonifractor sp.]
MDAIRWEGNTLYLLDQTRLPVHEDWIAYTDFRAVARAITDMVVRGAPAIGITAAYAYCLAALALRDAPDFAAAMEEAEQVLAASRPTAVNLFWALRRMADCLKVNGSTPEAIDVLIREAQAIHREDVEMNRTLGDFGAAVVPAHARILTHCNAGSLATGGYGTALGVVRSAFSQGKVDMVYADETRPLLQGARLTAYELVKDNIPCTLITDNMAGFLMAQGKVDLVVLGCDRMAANGDFANKIGTYSVAVNARYHGIPFYTALPSSTIDLSIPDGSGIPIEERPGQEVTHPAGVQTAPGQIRTWNPAFDVTPHQLLTGIITERGVIYPPFRENLAKLFG